MTLDKLENKKSAKILKIDCDTHLKNRFYSFGIVKGAKVKVKEQTLAKNTIEVEVGHTKIAMRVAEAKKIEVEYAN